MPFGVGRRSAEKNLGPRAHLVKRRVAALSTRGGSSDAWRRSWMSASRYEERLTKLVSARSSHATVGRWRLSILSPQPTLRSGVVEPGRCDEQAMIMGPHQRVGVAQQFDARRDIYPQQTMTRTLVTALA